MNAMTIDAVYVRNRSLASGIPLGGLGTGSVEIRDDGRFHDWEICNNNLWSGNPAHKPPEMWSEDACFAVRVKQEGAKHPVVRLLYDDDKRSEAISLKHDYCRIYNFPFLWNIERIAYRGRHPFADLAYTDSRLPLDIRLRTFSPFIPHNAKDSALPLAFFAFTVKNTGTIPCETSLMFSLRNFTGYDRQEQRLRNNVAKDDASVGIFMTADGMDPSDRTFGSVMASALDPDATWVTAWGDDRGLEGFPGAHTPGCGQTFQSFRDTGTLPCTPESWERVEKSKRTEDPQRVITDNRDRIHHWRGSLCSKVILQPGEQREIVFMMSWFFPNHYYRHMPDGLMGHMYANWFNDAREVAVYGRTHFTRLRQESERFCDALYDGIEPWLADSLSAQLTTFPQSFWWTKSGELTMWEGMACCQLLHAARTFWSSFMPLIFFPEVYMNMRKRLFRFTGEQEGDGSPQDRSLLGVELRQRRMAEAQVKQEDRKDLGGWYRERYKRLGYTEEDFGRRPPQPVDKKDCGAAPARPRAPRRGLASAIETLRDYQWTGDRAWLEELWPSMREGLKGMPAQDSDGDGLPDGAISFITYDHWFLPGLNCYRAVLWLGDLTAAIELARVMADDETVSFLSPVLARGSASFEKRLWNGEYYNLAWDFRTNRADRGCLADQVSGTLYPRLCGLPIPLPEEHVRSALRAVYKYNRNPEEGLLNGTDPHGRDDWRYFARYSDKGEDERWGGQWPTPWTGTEYYVAAVMIAEGLVDEGLQVIRDVYDRHMAFGQLYNHIECGEHYFRPLCVWAVLPALAGMVRNEQTGYLKISPKRSPDDFSSVFILPACWGRVRQKRNVNSRRVEIEVMEGRLEMRTLEIDNPWGEAARPALTLVCGETTCACTANCTEDTVRITVESPVTVPAGAVMTAVLTAG